MEILQLLLWGAAIIALLVPHFRQMAKEDLPKRNRYAILIFGAFVAVQQLFVFLWDPNAAVQEFISACQVFLPYCIGILMALAAHRLSTQQGLTQQRSVQQPSAGADQPLVAPKPETEAGIVV